MAHHKSWILKNNNTDLPVFFWSVLRPPIDGSHSHNVCLYLEQIIPYKVLRTEYKPYEAKRRLLGNFDMFLSDDRIRRLLPSHLGKHFYQRKRWDLSPVLSALCQLCKIVFLPVSQLRFSLYSIHTLAAYGVDSQIDFLFYCYVTNQGNRQKIGLSWGGIEP